MRRSYKGLPMNHAEPGRYTLFAGLLLIGSGFFIPPALATDIEGVQMASLDQPRVTLMVRRTPDGEALAAKGGDAGMAKLLGMDEGGSDKVATFAAFLDTGASGISISKQTADSLGIQRLSAHAGPNAPRI